MKGVPLDLYRSQLVIGDLYSHRIGASIEFGMDRETRLCGGIADEIDDDRMARQRSSAPILRNVSKHSMLDLIPLASAGGQMTDRDPQLCLVRQLLQLRFPQPEARAVTPAPIGNDEQLSSAWISPHPHLSPPMSHGFHGKFRRIMIHAHGDPAGIGRDIIDPIGHRFAQLRIQKIVDPNGFGRPCGLPFSPGVFEVAH